mgnify:FL=1
MSLQCQAPPLVADPSITSAFNDPSCVSTFAPVLDENAFRVSWSRTEDGSQQSGLLLCLQTSEVRSLRARRLPVVLTATRRLSLSTGA